MIAIVLTPSELTREDIAAFWAQGVCMDDWDYVVLAPVTTLYADSSESSGYGQSEYVFERILVGCCSNDWHRATYRGVEYAVGVAYHS